MGNNSFHLPVVLPGSSGSLFNAGAKRNLLNQLCPLGSGCDLSQVGSIPTHCNYSVDCQWIQHQTARQVLAFTQIHNQQALHSCIFGYLNNLVYAAGGWTVFRECGDLKVLEAVRLY